MKRFAFIGLMSAGLFTAVTIAADLQPIKDDCAACHGDKGASTDPEFPIIGGLSEFYLDEAMRAYREGARPCEKTTYPAGPRKGQETDMCQLASELDGKTIEALAAYYAELPFVPAKQEFDPAKAALGAKLHERSCEKCHAAGGTDPMDDAGILGGQWKHYLEEAFAHFKDGRRVQDEKMKLKFDELDDEQRDALLHFYASGGR